ncbi:MAG: hypothetical protein J1G06_05445 [Oscillospiraceae bacterium]|nr:hypothetical protein [Oscillospiraceae bacterium]
MIKEKKKTGIVVMVIGVLVFLSGFFCMHMSNENKGTTVTSFRYDSNGHMVMTGSGNIGGNPEGIEFFNAFAFFAFATGSICTVSGGILFLKAKIKDSAPVEKVYGRVIGKAENGTVIVELSDVFRQKLMPKQTVFLAVGDTGTFNLKKDIIVNFENGKL